MGMQNEATQAWIDEGAERGRAKTRFLEDCSLRRRIESGE
eukprot:gene51961-48712_t